MLTIYSDRLYMLVTPNSVEPVHGKIQSITSMQSYFALLTDEDTGAVYGINLNDVPVNGQMLQTDNEQTAAERLIAIFEASNGDTQ